jgi:hypothetical protein
MTEFKNLKVPKETHDLLNSRAKRLGMKVYALADALLLEGLKKENPALGGAVVESQQEVKRPEASTSQEPIPE